METWLSATDEGSIIVFVEDASVSSVELIINIVNIVKLKAIVRFGLAVAVATRGGAKGASAGCKCKYDNNRSS